MDLNEIKRVSELHNYITDKPYIINNDIWEYDIKQANINALLAMGRISEQEYNELSILPKQLREVAVGKKIQQDRSLQDSIYQGIQQAKYQLMIQNDINPESIIRIANDSIYYLHTLPLQNTAVNINNHILYFILKNRFTDFLNLRKIYVFLDLHTDEWNVDIKGINQSKHNLHEAFVSFICTLINAIHYGGRNTALSIYNDFYKKYVNKELPINYYREFNAGSGFRINGKLDSFIIMTPDCDIRYINIDYNLYILRILYSYILEQT